MTYKNRRADELRAQAVNARVAAAATTLPQVRNRAIRSAEALEKMADLADRTDLGRDKWAHGGLRGAGSPDD